jgi:uncharacterized protein GlcG (DUF336 family)
VESRSTCIVLNLISHDLARRVIDAGIAEAQVRDVALSFVILDSAGHLVAAARMDGAPFITTEVARGKAFASVATGGAAGTDLDQRYRGNPMVWGNAGPLGYGAPLLPARGSLPLRLDGRLIGAIGPAAPQPKSTKRLSLYAVRALAPLQAIKEQIHAHVFLSQGR